MKRIRMILAALVLAATVAGGVAGCQNCPPNRHSTGGGVFCSPNN